MVSSDLPPPKRSSGHETPLELAHRLVNTPRFAFFEDQRGVLYCEQVNHALLVLAAVGKTMGGKPTLYRDVITWNGHASAFNTQVREAYDRGFLIEEDMAYFTPNHWGVMKVKRDVTDLRLGKKFRYLCRAATPEARAGEPEDQWLTYCPKGRRPVQPFTAIAKRRLAGEFISKLDAAEAMFDEMSDEERDYFPKWKAA